MNGFREARRRKGLTQEEVVEQYNLRYRRKYTAAAISQFENGNRNPETKALINFADFYDVSVDYLLGLTDNPHREWRCKSE